METHDHPTPIIPIIIGDEDVTVKISNELFDLGFFVPAIRWPAVPKGKARLRVTMMVNHSKIQIDVFAQVLGEICRKHHVLLQSNAA